MTVEELKAEQWRLLHETLGTRSEILASGIFDVVGAVIDLEAREHVSWCYNEALTNQRTTQRQGQRCVVDEILRMIEVRRDQLSSVPYGEQLCERESLLALELRIREELLR